MAEVIRAQLHLEAVLGHVTRGHGHHAGVVDEDVDRPSRGERLLRKRLDRREAGEVEVRRSHIGVGMAAVDVGDRRGTLLRVADGQHHRRAPCSEHARRLEPDAAVSARDNGELAGEVGDVDPASLPRDGCTVQV